jgi:hypothetical protein
MAGNPGTVVEWNLCAARPVKRVEIPKPDGGIRKLGIPTGFRPGRSAHQAVEAAQQYIAAGYRWVVDLDLEKFFERVNHDRLMAKIAEQVSDKQWLRRRLRSVIWKQWKRGTVRFRELTQRGVKPWLAAKTAGTGHGPWRLADSPGLHIALPNAYFDSLGISRLTVSR